MKTSAGIIGLGLSVLLILLGMQAEPITGTIGVAFGSLLAFATVVSWVKQSR